MRDLLSGAWFLPYITSTVAVAILFASFFSTDYGLMSIIGIGFMLCMAAFFLRMFLVKMNEPPQPNPAAKALKGGSQNLPHPR